MKKKTSRLEVFAKKLKKMVRLKSFNFDRTLKKMGFVSKKSDGCGHPVIFIHKKFKVVVKRPYVAGDDHEVPEHGVETEFVMMPHAKENELIFIQPLVNVGLKARNKALDILCAWEEDCDEFVSDLHEGNVGMYGKKPVRIDW